MRILDAVFFLSFLAGKLTSFKEMLPWKKLSQQKIDVKCLFTIPITENFILV